MKRVWKTVGVLFLLGVLFLTTSLVSADGFFQKCTYCNNCETFSTEPFEVRNFKEGILVTGTVPDAELSGMGTGEAQCQLSGEPLEIIITTGDVHTRCHNTKGIKDITGEVLWRGDVVAGQFSMYIPLEEGDYNITVYMGQVGCANCPQAWVVPIEVNHKESCALTGTTTVTVRGNCNCYWLVPNSEFVEMGRFNQLPSVVQWAIETGRCDCTNCEGEVAPFYSNHNYPFSMRKNTFCDQPVCTACP